MLSAMAYSELTTIQPGGHLYMQWLRVTMKRDRCGEDTQARET